MRAPPHVCQTGRGPLAAAAKLEDAVAGTSLVIVSEAGEGFLHFRLRV